MIKNATAKISLSREHKTVSTRNVIIIDDNPTDLAELKKMVQTSQAPPCQVSSFSSVKDAINSDEIDQADLILLDDRLADGQKAEYSLKVLHDAKVSCPAIVVSSFVSRKREQNIIRHGAVQFTSKDELNPTSMQRLLAYGLTTRGLWSIDGL